MAETSFDVIIVGGGPGGYVTAIRARQLGLNAALVEAEHLGGICLNWGCIPTKALLRSAEIYHQAKSAGEFGIDIKDISFDTEKLVKRSRKVARRLSGGVQHLLKKNKVTVFDGRGRLQGPGKILVAKEGAESLEITAPHIILATGARARSVPGLEADGETVWTYKEAMIPAAMPKSILVVGSGAIGMEFASFYATFGVAVTVVEMLDRILPVEDAEISDLARKSFAADGIKIFTAATVSGLKKAKGKATATIATGGAEEKVTAEKVILAVGITGNVEDIGLETTKAKAENGHIVIDEWGQTDEPGLYAIGDVAGPPWLAHKASHEGIICIEKIAGEEGVQPLDTNRIPGCTYCRPQIASVGLTEAAAKEAGFEIRVGRFPYAGNGKAVALGEPEGLVKTVFDADTGELLGAHMIGAEVTELIQGYAIAMTLESTEAELIETVFPHPTLSEMMHEAVLDAYGRVIHF